MQGHCVYQNEIPDRKTVADWLLKKKKKKERKQKKKVTCLCSRNYRGSPAEQAARDLAVFSGCVAQCD